MIARLAPRRAAMWRYSAERSLFLVIEIAQAACDRHRRSETLPLRILPLSRFPALSRLPGHREARKTNAPQTETDSCPIRSLRGFPRRSLGRLQEWCTSE